jgi:hypothetical protein
MHISPKDAVATLLVAATVVPNIGWGLGLYAAHHESAASERRPAHRA